MAKEKNISRDNVVKKSMDDLIKDKKLPTDKTFKNAFAVTLQTAYDKGYHDARSHYNLNNNEPLSDAMLSTEIRS